MLFTLLATAAILSVGGSGTGTSNAKVVDKVVLNSVVTRNAEQREVTSHKLILYRWYPEGNSDRVSHGYHISEVFTVTDLDDVLTESAGNRTRLTFLSRRTGWYFDQDTPCLVGSLPITVRYQINTASFQHIESTVGLELLDRELDYADRRPYFKNYR